MITTSGKSLEAKITKSEVLRMAKTRPQKTFSDHFKSIDFYPDLPKLDLDEVLDTPYLIKDVLVVKGFKSEFGESDFALILLEDLETKKQSTTLCGGMVVVKKLEQARAQRLLPLIGTICKPAHYYDIV